MKISVIIPAYNEQDNIGRLIRYLLINNRLRHVQEVIVVDSGSNDNTVEVAQAAGARVLVSLKKGRSAQMNFGARMALGEILYFLHADSFPPASYAEDIAKAIDNRYQSGCYRLCFDYEHWLLKLNCWFTRFDFDTVRFGDQSLYVTKEAFIRAGMFDESLIVMEDQEIIKRIRRYARFLVFDTSVTTSAKKYIENGVFKLQGMSFLIYILYRMGLPQNQLLKVYRFMVGQNKL